MTTALLDLKSFEEYNFYCRKCDEAYNVEAALVR